MNNIFLDCGGHCGCSRKKFLAEYPESDKYKIYSFEPDSDLNEYCPNLINKAVWIEDCEQTFYKFWIDGGSSLLEKRASILEQTKPNYYPREEIIVQCFDIDKFIQNNFSKEDNIILKMDIEGAEYQVLPHMINNGSIGYINKLFIEWHDIRVGVSRVTTQTLEYNIRRMGIEVKIWDAMDKKYCPIYAHPDRSKYNAWG